MFLQHIANGFLASAIISVVSASFLLIYKTERFFHFAHGVSLTFTAYSVFALVKGFSWSPSLSIAVAITITFALGVCMHSAIYRPLRKRSATGTIMLIASIGIYSAIQNSISIIFGDDTRSFRWWPVEAGRHYFGVRITDTQIIILACSCVILLLVWAFMNYSFLGKCMKAVGNNPMLAQVVGIDVERVHFYAMGIGSALGGAAGILIASDVDATPTMGMQPLMTAVVAVIIGGGTMLGTVCGSLLVGMTQHVSVMWLPTKWQDAIIFAILLILLLIRPQGFFGKAALESRA